MSIKNGMFTGKKIFFHNVKNNILKQKIIHILHRLEAVVESFFNNEIDMVIIDDDNTHISGIKRKFSTPLPHRAKKIRLLAGVNNNPISSENSGGHQSNNNDFLTKAQNMGCKVKSVNVLWSWLNQFYKPLVDNCYLEDTYVKDKNKDICNGVKCLDSPALKILDPFGGCRPLVKEECGTHNTLFEEMRQLFVEDKNDSRKSNGTGRRSLRKSKLEELGYCECCNKQYTRLFTHLKEDCHQKFMNNEENFSSINKIISKVSDIENFFRNRLSLRQSYKFMKQNVPLKPRLQKEDIIPVVKEDCTQDRLCDVEEKVDTCSSSDSSCSSTSDSFDSSSDEESQVINKYDVVSSTPILQKKPIASFSEDSISNECQYQSELSEHVNVIVNHLNVEDILHVTSSQHFDGVSNDLITSLSCEGLYLPNYKNNSSVVLQPRFRWCVNCGRNHVPIHKEDFTCTFSPSNKKDTVMIESHNVDYLYKSVETGDELHTETKTNVPFISIVLKKLTKAEIKDNNYVNEKEEDNEFLSIKNVQLLPIESDVQATSKENTNVSESALSDVLESMKVNDKKNICNDCSKRYPGDFSYSQGTESHFRPTRMAAFTANQSIHNIMSTSISKTNYGNEKSANILKINTRNEHLLPFEACVEVIDVTPEESTANHSVSESVISTVIENIDIGDAENVCNDYINKIPQIFENYSQGIDSPSRPRRMAAVAANRGIKNINKLMTSSISKTITCLQRSYSPMEFDPRVKMNNLKFSPDETKFQKRVFSERNE